MPGARLVLLDRGGSPVELRLGRRLASGSYSEIFLATHPDGELAVVKIPRGDRSTARSNLQVEHRILEQVDHPNLVRSFAYGEDPLALACERLYPNPLLLLSQPDNRKQLPNDTGTRYYPLPPSVALALGRDLLRGLEALHCAGFVHHDVKPENLMVRIARLPAQAGDRDVLAASLAGRGQGVLIDLGGSRSLGYLDDLRRGEVDGRLVPPQLTPLYSPPEALPGEGATPALGPTVDVYAAALLLYALISGRGPYDHTGAVKDLGLSRVLELKACEARGELLPIAYEALAGAPGCRAIAGELYGFLSTCFQRRVEARPTARDGRRFIEELERTLQRINRR